MSYSAELIAIESRFNSQWADRTPVAYGNLPYAPIVGTAYVRLIVLTGRALQASMGAAPLYRHPGVIDVSVFIPEGSATKPALDLADAVVAIFRGAQFSGILCRPADVRNLGVVGGWFQVNVSIPYHRDEIF